MIFHLKRGGLIHFPATQRVPFSDTGFGEDKTGLHMIDCKHWRSHGVKKANSMRYEWYMQAWRYDPPDHFLIP